MPTFLLKKTVDRSLLTDGFSIPLEFQPLVHSLYESPIAPGEKRKIKIIIEREGFDATLINSNFNRETFAGHKDILQIRYSGKSPLALKFQGIFDYIAKMK